LVFHWFSVLRFSPLHPPLGDKLLFFLLRKEVGILLSPLFPFFFSTLSQLPPLGHLLWWASDPLLFPTRFLRLDLQTCSPRAPFRAPNPCKGCPFSPLFSPLGFFFSKMTCTPLTIFLAFLYLAGSPFQGALLPTLEHFFLPLFFSLF